MDAADMRPLPMVNSANRAAGIGRITTMTAPITGRIAETGEAAQRVARVPNVSDGKAASSIGFSERVSPQTMPPQELIPRRR